MPKPHPWHVGYTTALIPRWHNSHTTPWPPCAPANIAGEAVCLLPALLAHLDSLVVLLTFLGDLPALLGTNGVLVLVAGHTALWPCLRR